MYYFPDPPYFLLAAGLFISLASGLAFDSVLKQSVQEWSKNRSTRSLANMRGVQLLTPFVGIAIGACVFLCAGMEIFGFPGKLAYAIALPMTIFISWLVWWQLGKTLAELDRGGSAALDLDSFES
ncbi:MAG: hypothetical protein HC780_10165 [Leptolyngbyaceae cyanobacterium CSU_1_3]|nr:hypothetical protein [Leptolyngbyaceae cyanobacterium CSU_1_3]